MEHDRRNQVKAAESELAKGVERVEGSLPGVDLLVEPVRLVVETASGLVHADLASSRWGQCHTLRRGGNGTGGLVTLLMAGLTGRGAGTAQTETVETEVETSTLGTLLSSGRDVCTLCVRVGTLLPEQHVAPWAVSAQDVLDAASRDRGRSARAARERKDAAQRVLAAHEHVTTLPEAGGGLVELLRAQVNAAEEALGSDQVRQKLLAKVKVALVGKAAVNGGYVFDDEQVLLGMTRYVRYEWNETMRDVVDLYAVRNEEGERGVGPVVLLVPRYVAEYVATLPKARKNGLHPSATVKGDDTELTLETAAALWDPESEGALASLVGALQAARVI